MNSIQNACPTLDANCVSTVLAQVANRAWDVCKKNQTTCQNAIANLFGNATATIKELINRPPDYGDRYRFGSFLADMFVGAVSGVVLPALEKRLLPNHPRIGIVVTWCVGTAVGVAVGMPLPLAVSVNTAMQTAVKIVPLLLRG